MRLERKKRENKGMRNWERKRRGKKTETGKLERRKNEKKLRRKERKYKF